MSPTIFHILTIPQNMNANEKKAEKRKRIEIVDNMTPAEINLLIKKMKNTSISLHIVLMIEEDRNFLQPIIDKIKEKHSSMNQGVGGGSKKKYKKKEKKTRRLISVPYPAETTENVMDVTFHHLSQWYKHLFEQLGWMVLVKSYGYADKIQCYKNGLKRLKISLEMKLKDLKDVDRKHDIKIMLDNVNILCNYVKAL